MNEMGEHFDKPADPQTDARIDRALRTLGSADPPVGLEARILARLDTRIREDEVRRSRWRAPRLTLGLAVACACALVVAGSVTHSRRMAPAVPGVRLPAAMSAGVGAASAAQVTSQPVTTPADSRPRSVRCAEAALPQPGTKTPNKSPAPCEAEGHAVTSPQTKSRVLPVPEPAGRR